MYVHWILETTFSCLVRVSAVKRFCNENLPYVKILNLGSQTQNRIEYNDGCVVITVAMQCKVESNQGKTSTWVLYVLLVPVCYLHALPNQHHSGHWAGPEPFSTPIKCSELSYNT